MELEIVESGVVASAATTAPSTVSNFFIFFSEVTIIPTYDSDVLGYWVADNEDALTEHKIDLAPSASRCTINLQDHETSCAAYRLEF